MSRTNTPPAATAPSCGTTIAGTPEGRFARHMRCGVRGLPWYHRLGELALACCPLGMRDRTRRLRALAAANPGCSLSLLHKVSKFFRQYTAAEVERLESAGLGWDRLAILLSIPRARRGTAVDEVIRLGLTSREVRDWKAEQYGLRPSRGRRAPRPLPGHSPAVQARALTNDCHRLNVRHRITPDVFERVLRNLEDGVPLTPQELALMQSAVGAVGSLLEQFGRLHSLLLRITAPGEEVPDPTVMRTRRRPRRGTNASAGRSGPRT